LTGPRLWEVTEPPLKAGAISILLDPLTRDSIFANQEVAAADQTGSVSSSGASAGERYWIPEVAG
jgi:hypothetical protein